MHATRRIAHWSGTARHVHIAPAEAANGDTYQDVASSAASLVDHEVVVFPTGTQASVSVAKSCFDHAG